MQMHDSMILEETKQDYMTLPLNQATSNENAITNELCEPRYNLRSKGKMAMKPNQKPKQKRKQKQHENEYPTLAMIT
jgi:hypothetical protein